MLAPLLTQKPWFLTGAPWNQAKCVFLAGDASNRTYYRLTLPHETAVLMHAPAPTERLKDFIEIATLLKNLGLSAPRILEIDEAAEYLLIEDLGDDTYGKLLKHNYDMKTPYKRAVEVLVHIHQNFKGEEASLLQYNLREFLREASLFSEWYAPAVLKRPLTLFEQEDFKAILKGLYENASPLPQTLVLRDYLIDNLLWLPERPGIKACGLIDFQDALKGPIVYDLVSLLEDARCDVDPTLSNDLLTFYLKNFKNIDPQSFYENYNLWGAQRHLKILGIFTRLSRRDGKHRYLDFIPRIWRWLEKDLNHPSLAPLKEWFLKVIPPSLRKIPEREDTNVSD